WFAVFRAAAVGKLAGAGELVVGWVPVTPFALGPGPASRSLLELLEAQSPRAIVLGSSASATFGRVSLGSTVERVLDGATCPVVVTPKGYAGQAALIGPVAVGLGGTVIGDRDGARRRVGRGPGPVGAGGLGGRRVAALHPGAGRR